MFFMFQNDPSANTILTQNEQNHRDWQSNRDIFLLAEHNRAANLQHIIDDLLWGSLVFAVEFVKN